MSDVQLNPERVIRNKVQERVNSDTCDYCDSPGGRKTCENQVCMPINRRVRAIDYCIHPLIATLNAGGIPTVASCCGHKKLHGRIDLEDGRVLIITNNPDQLVWQAREQK